MGASTPSSPVWFNSNGQSGPIATVWDLNFTAPAVIQWSAFNVFTVPSGKKLIAAIIWIHNLDANLDYMHFEANNNDITSDPGGATPTWVKTTNTDEREAHMNPNAGYHLHCYLTAAQNLQLRVHNPNAVARNIKMSGKFFLIDA